MCVNSAALWTLSSLSPKAQHSGLLKAGEVAQQEEALAINPADLSFTPSIHLLEGENRLSQVLLLPPVYHDIDGE